ncbi:TetR/AcrR family transcriptional regulator [Mycolicibacterium mageritense]|uniref:DNA-binding transcriptional repressor TetR n=1 Tax=Mycolicibacterium mageritense TaxID=53462 RepID=A0AAI8TSS5_MYCME|nr:TetR/AcrR family transcriptional regulator [Mycolicibacterium mageritense]BDY28289.1 DNA-binding transcriptional repressor TetR [Mycolicibacterium mageritense]GJJ21642.1 putative regulatory protein, TetR family [Mycolicibacterium mageritense]
MVRGQQRVDAILTATLDLVAEHGYPALTMDAVAARANASKATIYRRWRNKAELVKAALDAYDARQNSVIPDTGSLRGDLMAVLDMLRDKSSEHFTAIIGSLVAASRHDRELAAALREHVDNEELSPFHDALHRAIGRGDLPPDTDAVLIHDVAEAMILRQLQIGAALDDAFAARLVDDILLRLLHREGNS